MIAPDRAKQAVKKIFTLMNFALLITVLYVGFVGYEAYFQKVSGAWVENNKLNSLGDFLAGLFAPLAFFWLVITVIIQGKELALTRDEMEETREVMKEQAKEARAHKEFVEQQTAIMKRQAATADLQAKFALESYQKNLQVTLYDKRMGFYQHFKNYLEVCTREIGRKTVSIQHYETIKHHNVEAKALFGQRSNIDLWVNQIADFVFDYTANISDSRHTILLAEWAHLIKFEEFEKKFLPYVNLVDE